MARNKKVEILSNSQEVLHPMTDGDCVIFEDGQTLTQKLSEDDSVKYTPEIVNSSPMFKVGEGNTVDYSDNVLDGAYERATLQGQTYVNYIQESSADEVTLPTPFAEYERTQHNTLTSDEEGTLGINLVGQSYVNALQHDSEEEFVVLGESLEFQEKKVEYTNEGQIKSAMLKGQTLVNLLQKPTSEPKLIQLHSKGHIILGQANLLKPNTTYTFFYKITEPSDETVSVVFNLSSGQGSPDYGLNVLKDRLVFTTPVDYDPSGKDIRVYYFKDCTCYISNTVLLEGDHTNEDIPYFEGMQSVTVSTRLENKLGTCTVGSIAQYAKSGKTFTTTDASTRQCVLYSTTQAATNPANLKPNTEYIIGFQISNLVLDGLSSIDLTFSSGTVDSGNCLFTSVTGGDSKVTITSNGTYRIRRKTTDLITSSLAVIKGFSGQWEQSGSTLRSLTISNIMYIEYQNGMENWDLPYFEDYQVMKPVQVESVNKNIVDFYDYTETRYGITNTIRDGIFTITGTSTRSGGRNNFYGYSTILKAGKTYVFSVHDLVETGAKIPGFYITNSKTGMALYAIGMHENGVKVTSQKITVQEDTLVHIWNNTLEGETYNTTCKLMLEESDTATEYVPHQSKTTYSWDEVILRKVGDVEDTLDLTTGEWVQRIGEKTFTSDNDYQVSIDEATPNITHIRLDADANEYAPNQRNGRNPLTNIIPNNPIYRYSDNMEGIYVDASGILVLCLSREKATTVDEFKTWLVSNPITVQYVLTKPIVHKVNLSRPNLQVYDDITHIHTKCLDGTLIPNIYLPSDISYPAILEPSKTYNVCVNHTEVSADNPLKVNVGGTEITMTDSRMTLTTPTTLANGNVSFTGKGNKIKESMLIKNSSLLTRDLPHFNGIGSVQLGKTIENLCSASSFKAGNSDSTITWYDNHAHTKISNKAGSCVFAYELVKLLKNGKKYFIYSPQTLDNSSCRVSFRRVYNNSLSYARQQTVLPKNGKCIMEIDQQDNPYTHICVGCHHEIPLNTEFDMYRPIICEYEPGMEDWDWESIGYFTGTKNIGNEFMRVQNKNLVDKSKIVKGVTYNHGGFSEISEYGGRLTLRQKDSIPVKPNSVYTVSISPSDFTMGYYLLDKDKNIIYDSGWIPNPVSFLIDRPNAKYLIFNLKKQSGEEIEVSDVTSIQLEESSTATIYTAHKHNGLYITKDQPINLTWEQGAIFYESGVSWSQMTNNVNSMRIRTPQPLNLEPNKTYRISLGSDKYQYGIQLYDNSNNGAFDYGWNTTDREFIFTTTKDKYKVGIAVGKIDPSNSTPITPSESVHAQVRLEEVTDVVLRGIGNVYDELDITRGIYTQRISEMVLDGDDSNLVDKYVIAGYNKTYVTLRLPNARTNVAYAKWHNELLKDEYLGASGTQSQPLTFALTEDTTIRFTFFGGSNKTDLEQEKEMLKKYPITIQYILATPIVHKVHIVNKDESNTEVTKPNDVFTLPTLYTEQTHIDLTNNGIVPKVQSRDYIAYPVSPMISRTYTLQHNLTGGVSNLTVDLLGRTQSVSYQNHKSLIYSPETMDAVLHNELRISGKGKISKVMYIDGGYMDRDIPYIEGMKNACNPIVKNVGKNLFNIDDLYSDRVTIIAENEFKVTSVNLFTFIDVKVKPHTQYRISYEIYRSGGNASGLNMCVHDGKNVGYYDSTTRIFILTNVPSSYEKRTFTFTSKSDYISLSTLDGSYIKNLIITETNVENEYEPYKENICYVGSWVISYESMIKNQSVTGETGQVISNAEYRYSTDYIEITTSRIFINSKDSHYVFIYDKDKKYIGRYPENWSTSSYHDFDVTEGYFKVVFNHTNKQPDIYTYIASEEQIFYLRSLPHGVHDEIDLETGKYIQRVGEITFDGTESWLPGYASWSNKYTYYNNTFVDIKVMKGDNGSGQAYYDALRCPQLHRSYMGRLASVSIDGVCSYYYSGYQRIFISKQDCATVDELKLWLQENPITVQYELPEPIVKDIVIHNYPHSYEGGHVIIENGDPNTPIPAQLTYRAVTNRSGQIQQHTEQVEKQDKEINELETLILANIHLSQTR